MTTSAKVSALLDVLRQSLKWQVEDSQNGRHQSSKGDQQALALAKTTSNGQVSDSSVYSMLESIVKSSRFHVVSYINRESELIADSPFPLSELNEEAPGSLVCIFIAYANLFKASLQRK
jgi:hypothetical protein